MTFITKRSENDIIGVKTIINSVNFQLITHKNMRLPKNCRKFLINMERLSEQTEYTVAISFPNLDRSYPVLFLS